MKPALKILGTPLLSGLYWALRHFFAFASADPRIRDSATEVLMSQQGPPFVRDFVIGYVLGLILMLGGMGLNRLRGRRGANGP